MGASALLALPQINTHNPKEDKAMTVDSMDTVCCPGQGEENRQPHSLHRSSAVYYANWQINFVNRNSLAPSSSASCWLAVIRCLVPLLGRGPGSRALDVRFLGQLQESEATLLIQTYNVNHSVRCRKDKYSEWVVPQVSSTRIIKA